MKYVKTMKQVKYFNKNFLDMQSEFCINCSYNMYILEI